MLNYSETDISGSRAAPSPGWGLDHYHIAFQNRPDRHDDGVKTFFGKTGNFTGEDIVDIILQQPAAPHFIARKLYRYFVRDDFDKQIEDKLAATLRADKFQIAPFLETIFLSKDFYSPAAYGKQIKSPTQLVISTYKKLGITGAPTFPSFPTMIAQLGQSIFYPPNVKGWDGGKAWINPATIFERENVARYILFPEQMPVDPDPLAYLDGSKALSGENIHQQFLAMVKEGQLHRLPRFRPGHGHGHEGWDGHEGGRPG